MESYDSDGLLMLLDDDLFFRENDETEEDQSDS